MCSVLHSSTIILVKVITLYFASGQRAVLGGTHAWEKEREWDAHQRSRATWIGRVVRRDSNDVLSRDLSLTTVDGDGIAQGVEKWVSFRSPAHAASVLVLGGMYACENERNRDAYQRKHGVLFEHVLR